MIGGQAGQPPKHHLEVLVVAQDIQRELQPVEERLHHIPGNYRLEYGGQFEAQQEAGSRLAVLGALAVVGVFLLLWKCLGSWRAALQILLVNIPLAALGSVAALLLLNQPTAAALQAAPQVAVVLRGSALCAEHLRMTVIDRPRLTHSGRSSLLIRSSDMSPQ